MHTTEQTRVTGRNGNDKRSVWLCIGRGSGGFHAAKDNSTGFFLFPGIPGGGDISHL